MRRASVAAAMGYKVEAPLKAGDRVPYKHGMLRVLAVAEGYAMVRYPRAQTWCIPVAELLAYQKPTAPKAGADGEGD